MRLLNGFRIDNRALMVVVKWIRSKTRALNDLERIHSFASGYDSSKVWWGLRWQGFEEDDFKGPAV